MEKTKQLLFGNRSTNKFRSLMSNVLFLQAFQAFQLQVYVCMLSYAFYPYYSNQ